jgi:glycosyltransferase involved in cell wall biosynthesis
MNTICLIIPCFNEAKRFPVSEFRNFLQTNEETCFCLVNDGSTDDTEGMLESLREIYPDRISVITQPENRGKAAAVQAGMLASLLHFQSAYYGYFDADLSTPLEESFLFRSRLTDKQSLQYVFGSRVAILGVKIERSLYRHLIGRVIATFISNILHLRVYDTQCGAKLFTRSMAESVFEKPFITRWLFDVEILARIIGMVGYDNIENVAAEVPVSSWTDKGGSKISWTYGFRVWFDLMRIRSHYKDIL